MKTENELLCLCSKLRLEKRNVEKLLEITEDALDWQYIKRFAYRHKVYPLLYKNLTQYCSRHVPQDVAAELKMACLRNGARNLAHVATLLSLQTLFTQHEIEFLAFKGPVFTEDVYGDLTLRAYGDLDILVAKKDLRKAIQLLLEDGYKTDIDLNLEQYRKLVDKGHHAVLIKESSVVEIHWELTGRYFSSAVSIENLAGRAECVRLNGKDVMTLGPEDLLVYLCSHGSRHYWLQLDSVCCVNEIINSKKGLDWDTVFDRAQEQGAFRMLILGLLLARLIFQQRYSVEVNERISKFSNLDRVAEQVAQRIFDSAETALEHPSYKDELWYNYAVMDSRWNWLRYSVRPLLNTTHSDWLWLKIPAVLSPVYYVLRPLRLLIKYVGKVFR